jgi:hypothetical protein
VENPGSPGADARKVGDLQDLVLQALAYVREVNGDSIDVVVVVVVVVVVAAGNSGFETHRLPWAGICRRLPGTRVHRAEPKLSPVKRRIRYVP